jgi:hypothetical protein
MRKSNLTTKDTKSTKFGKVGLRTLRVLRGENSFPFGCGFAALGKTSNKICRSFFASARGDDRAALLTAIARYAGAARYRFKVVAFHTGGVEAFGAVTIAQIIGRDSQMTMLATHCALPFGK